MKKQFEKCISLLIVWLLTSVTLAAQVSPANHSLTGFTLDPQLPSTPLTDTTTLTLLNSRLGSRFAFSFLTGGQGIRTGNLDYDTGKSSALLIAIDVKDSPVP